LLRGGRRKGGIGSCRERLKAVMETKAVIGRGGRRWWRRRQWYERWEAEERHSQQQGEVIGGKEA